MRGGKLYDSRFGARMSGEREFYQTSSACSTKPATASA